MTLTPKQHALLSAELKDLQAENDRLREMCREAIEAGQKLADERDRLAASGVQLRAVLQDTLNMLRAAHIQCGVSHDKNPRVIKARALLANVGK